MRSQQSRYPLMRRSEVNNQPQQATVFLDADQTPPVLTVKKPDGSFVSLEGGGGGGEWGDITGTLSDQTDLQDALDDLSDAIDLKAPIASPTFTGTVSGITKAMVGLGNVDNTSDANKPVSTATQTALDLKADKPIYQFLETDSTHNETDGSTTEADLTVSLEANKVYFITYHLSVFSSTAQPIVDLTFNYPAGITSVIFSSSGPNEVLSVATSETPANGSAVVRFLTVGSGFYGAGVVNALVTMGASAGDMTFRWLSKSVGDAEMTLKAGSSFVRVEEIA